MKQVLATQELMDPCDQTGKNFLVKAEHWARYAFAVKFLNRQKAQTVYDVACGTGYGTQELQATIQSAYGFDRNSEFLEIAQDRYPTLIDHFYRLDLDRDSFLDFLKLKNLPAPQAIVCYETLEHLQYPAKILAEFGQLLKPGGWLICSVPNAKFEQILENGQPANPFHLHLFTLTKIQDMLNKNGFRIVGTYGQPWTNLLIRNTKRPVRKWFDRFLASEQKFKSMAHKVAWPTRILIKQSYPILVICQKV
jgi:SAM-dependent methyltransferase